MTAERANASRSRFVAAASHDLVQPLSVAKLFISAIGGPAMSTAARNAAGKAQAALMSVDGILDALLNISKLESGKAAVVVCPVHMHIFRAQLRDAGYACGIKILVKPTDALALLALTAELGQTVANTAKET